MNDLTVTQPRGLDELEALKSILFSLENANCPDKVLMPLREWVMDLFLDKGKYDRWMEMCKR
jgi:hypothetical protein